MDRLALANATYVWLITIPMYGLGGIFFFLFYKYEHIWKSRGVIVGYEYDDKEHDDEEEDISDGGDLEMDEIEELTSEKENRWVAKFKGHWVNHLDSSGEPSH